MIQSDKLVLQELKKTDGGLQSVEKLKKPAVFLSEVIANDTTINIDGTIEILNIGEGGNPPPTTNTCCKIYYLKKDGDFTNAPMHPDDPPFCNVLPEMCINILDFIKDTNDLTEIIIRANMFMCWKDNFEHAKFYGWYHANSQNVAIVLGGNDSLVDAQNNKVEIVKNMLLGVTSEIDIIYPTANYGMQVETHIRLTINTLSWMLETGNVWIVPTFFAPLGQGWSPSITIKEFCSMKVDVFELRETEPPMPLLIIWTDPENMLLDIEPINGYVPITIAFNQNIQFNPNWQPPNTGAGRVYYRRASDATSGYLTDAQITIENNLIKFLMPASQSFNVEEYEITVFGNAFITSNNQTNDEYKFGFLLAAMTPGLYILEGTNADRGNLFVYANNNGVKGTLIETITYAQTDRWDRVLFYAPEVAYISNNCFRRWFNGSSISNSTVDTTVPTKLSFPKAIEVGSSFGMMCNWGAVDLDFPNATFCSAEFMNRAPFFNGNIDLSKIKRLNNPTGNNAGFLTGAFAFNKPVILPEIEMIDGGVNWQGLLVPAGNSFMHNVPAFKGVLSVPKLKTIGGGAGNGVGFLTGLTAVENDLVFENLETITIGAPFLFGIEKDGIKITFKKLVLNDVLFSSTNSSTQFISANPALTNQVITVRFEKPQILSDIPDMQSYKFFAGRWVPIFNISTIREGVILEIHKDSLNVNVANRTWAGHTFKEIRLLNDDGSYV